MAQRHAAAAAAAANPAAPDHAGRRRARATLRDLWDQLGIVVSAYDTRLALAMFGGDEAEAVRVIRLAWDWMLAAGLQRRDAERVLRHFQHSGRSGHEALRLWEATCRPAWLLFDRYLAAAATVQQAAAGQAASTGGSPGAAVAKQQPAVAVRTHGGTLDPGCVPASYADMLLRGRPGLERASEMMCIPPGQLQPFLQAFSQRLSPAAAGALVAQLPGAHPPSFRPSAEMADSLAMLVEELAGTAGRSVASGKGSSIAAVDWAALASLCRSDHAGPLQAGAGELRQRLSALQQALGQPCEAVAALALQQPSLLRAPPTELAAAVATLRQYLPADMMSRLPLLQDSWLLTAAQADPQRMAAVLHLWLEVVGVAAAAFVERRRQVLLPQDSESSLLLTEPDATLRQRLAALRQAVGLTAEQAALVAFEQPRLLQREASSWAETRTTLEQHLGADALSGLGRQPPRQLASALLGLQDTARVLHQWMQVLGVPYDERMTRQGSLWFVRASSLLDFGDAQLRRRLEGLAATLGVPRQRAGAVALANPTILLDGPAQLRLILQPLRRWVSGPQLATMLESQHSDFCDFYDYQWATDHVADLLHLWIDLVGLPADALIAGWQAIKERSTPLLRVQHDEPLQLRYADSTIQRRVTAIRQAAGMTAEQAAALVFAHPDLLLRQHTMVRAAGAWLAQHVPPGEMAALVQADPGLLAASEWQLRETAAKLALWTRVVGAPRQAVMAQYAACVGEAHLPDLAAAYFLVLERAPQLLHGPDGAASLAWWTDLPLSELGLVNGAAGRMMQHWIDSEAGKRLLAGLRAGDLQGWLPGTPAPPASAGAVVAGDGPAPAGAGAAAAAAGGPAPVPASSAAGGAHTLHGQRTAMDEHNLMRIRSMSEPALRRRIRAIKKPAKLQSFAHELEECGLAELAAEARAALAALGGAQQR